jgi:3-phenylpropionate/trans-cinnamate dioxygenase ferredoxin subunit
MPWHAVASVDAVPAGDYVQVEIDGTFIAVFNVAGQFYAIDDVCTHDGGGLAGGAMDGGVVICPRHGARFCLRTGAALTPPAYEAVRTYPTRVVEGTVQIESE